MDQTYVLRQAYRDETRGCPNYSRVWNVDSVVTGGLRRLALVGVCEHCGAEPRQIGQALQIDPEPQQGEGTIGVVNTEASHDKHEGDREDCCGRG